MKIYVTGCVASGKSTFSKKLATKLNYPLFHLDHVVHKPYDYKESTRRSDDEQESIFASIMAMDNWVVEDNGRPQFLEAMEKSDKIILVCPPKPIRYKRIITRWCKQNLGLEKCSYTPNREMLHLMFKWCDEFDNGNDGLLKRLRPYKEKVVFYNNW